MMKKVILLFVCASIAFLFAISVIAQEIDENATAPTVTFVVSDERLTLELKEKENPALKDLKLERPVRPRLPNGFGPVVDTNQKEKIYEIQRAYNELIAFLELRIRLLKDERDTKINVVLTPAQLDRIKRPAAHAGLRR